MWIAVDKRVNDASIVTWLALVSAKIVWASSKAALNSSTTAGTTLSKAPWAFKIFAVSTAICNAALFVFAGSTSTNASFALAKASFAALTSSAVVAFTATNFAFASASANTW